MAGIYLASQDATLITECACQGLPVIQPQLIRGVQHENQLGWEETPIVSLSLSTSPPDCSPKLQLEPEMRLSFTNTRHFDSKKPRNSLAGTASKQQSAQHSADIQRYVLG